MRPLRFWTLLLILSSLHGDLFAGGETPRVFLVDPAVLVRARERYRAGEKAILPVVKKLLRDSERALDQAPPTVADKPQLPPSGDRHDFLSFSPYWWPDPAASEGLPYIRRDGEVNPSVKEVGDDAELSLVIKTVSTLGLGYFFSGEEAYAAHAARFLRMWFLDPATRMNPNLTYAQLIPGRSEVRGTGIIDAHSLPELIDGVGLLEGSPSWTAADQRGLQEWFAAYLNWLRESENGQKESRAKNNHGTWYDVQATGVALFVGDTAFAAATVREARAKRIASQIEPDGSQPHELARTKSWDYSVFNLTAFFRLASLGERVKVNLWHYATPDGRGLRAAVDWLLPVVTGERAWTHQQIAAKKMSGIPPLLMKAAEVWGGTAYQAAAEGVKGSTLRTDRSMLHLRTL